jgi:hypothetical protein
VSFGKDSHKTAFAAHIDADKSDGSSHSEAAMHGNRERDNSTKNT